MFALKVTFDAEPSSIVMVSGWVRCAAMPLVMRYVGGGTSASQRGAHSNKSTANAPNEADVACGRRDAARAPPGKALACGAGDGACAAASPPQPSNGTVRRFAAGLRMPPHGAARGDAHAAQRGAARSSGTRTPAWARRHVSARGLRTRACGKRRLSSESCASRGCACCASDARSTRVRASPLTRPPAAAVEGR